MADQLPTSFHLTVVTRERKIVETDAIEVVLPAYDGEIGVLPGHTPLLTSLKVGVMSTKTGSPSPFGGVDSRKNASKIRAIRRSSVSIAAAYAVIFSFPLSSATFATRIRSNSRLRTATFSGVLRSCAVSALRKKFASANFSSQGSIARSRDER